MKIVKNVNFFKIIAFNVHNNNFYKTTNVFKIVLKIGY